METEVPHVKHRGRAASHMVIAKQENIKKFLENKADYFENVHRGKVKNPSELAM